LPPPNFESGASTNFTTPALRTIKWNTIVMNFFY
jgi:hypothetical protein